MATVELAHFTDPNCPFAYSAEPIRWRVRWVYGEQIAWRTRVVVLSEDRESYLAKGFTPEVMEQSLAHFAQDPGMPIEASPRPAPNTRPACTWIVAARERVSQGAAERLTRQLRLGQMLGGTLDEDATLDKAARDAGLDPAQLRAWAEEADVVEAVEADKVAARHPLPEALALDARLAGWEEGRRYTCPTYVLTHDATTMVIPGFNPIRVYETVLANLAPGLEQRATPETALEVLRWAGEPLATLEVAEVLGVSRDAARERLVDEGATEHPAGSDAFWTAD